MTLKEYLEKYDIKHQDFAKSIGYHVVSFSRIVNDIRKPSHEKIAAIDKATGGKVTYYDFFPIT